MKKNKINCINVNNLLSKIYENREEEIYMYKENERNMLEKKSKAYENIYTAINNVPNAFRETKAGIETSIETYLETLNELQGMENEKFYKEGFSDAINLIMDCINRNVHKTKEL